MHEEPDPPAQVVRDVIARRGTAADQLVTILADIQEACRYLPAAALREVATALGLPLIRVYAVATYYKAFSLEPRGQHLVCVCLGTACHVRGAQGVLDEFVRELGVAPGGVTEDGEFSLEAVNCIGACALGPVVMIDGEYHGHMTPGKVRAILDKHADARPALQGQPA